MRLIEYAFLAAMTLFFSTKLKAVELNSTDQLTEADYSAAERYGHVDREKLDKLNEKARRSVNPRRERNKIAQAFSKADKFEAAAMADKATDALLKQADAVLRAEGHSDTADEIKREYEAFYIDSFINALLFGFTEIGDHPPANEWLDGVHKKIHDKIGDHWCQYFHFHDIEILNRGFPVVFAPESYELDDYKDHFAGHYLGQFSWLHHGLAGVITYWAVQVTCSGATFGMGAVTFICAPISGLAEHVMDKRVAPPLAEKIWLKAH